VPSPLDDVEAIAALGVLLSTLDDVTRRLLDERDAALGAARDALVRRDELLASVARDLRGPIELIVASAEQLERAIAAPAHRRHVAQIVRSVERARRLVRNLAELDGQITIHAEPVDVAQVVLAAIEAQQLPAADASVMLLTELAPALPLALADETRLQEALEHLLGHAIDHGRDGDTITIHVTGDGGWLHLSVHHPGEPRRRGLGLELCRAVIAAHGGGLWTTPDRGGIMVTLTLPIASVPELVD
jgi:signal transduction histidine kinase